MKRLLVLVIAIVCIGLLSGCCLSHEWEDATCEEPKTCAKCDKTEGEPLGHEWEEATCDEPETCSVCGDTQGKPLGHEWVDATCEEPKTCEECGKTMGDPLGHAFGQWELDGEEMVSTCENCGEEERREADRELIGTEWLLGQWTSYYGSGPDWETYYYDYGFLANADGTAVLTLDWDFEGTWVWDEYRDFNDGSACYDFIFYYEGDAYQVSLYVEDGVVELVAFIDDVALWMEK